MTAIWGPGPTEYRFFWHSELARFTSEEEAQTFVQRLKDAPLATISLKRLLDPSGIMFQDEDELAEAVVRMLTGGQLIADLITTTSFEPMWQYYAPFRDRAFALNFLAQFRH